MTLRRSAAHADSTKLFTKRSTHQLAAQESLTTHSLHAVTLALIASTVAAEDGTSGARNVRAWQRRLLRTLREHRGATLHLLQLSHADLGVQRRVRTRLNAVIVK